MDYELLILLGISALCFYIKIKYGIIFIVFITFVLVFGFFFTSNGMDLVLEDIEQAVMYYKSYTGDYELMYPKFKEFHIIRKKFKLNESYKPCGVFYDNPEKDKKEKLRAVIGIIDTKCESLNNNNDFSVYMKDNGYKKTVISKTQCVIGIYDCFFSVMKSFIFIAKIYIKMTNLKFFARMYNPNWKDNHIKVARKNYKKKVGILEVYDHKQMRFYIPLKNEEMFYLYSNHNNNK